MFNCRSFTYFPATSTCRLSGDDVVSAGQQSLVATAGAVFYQKAPCLDRQSPISSPRNGRTE